MNQENDSDLSTNKYKKTEFVTVEYPPSNEILGELDRLNTEMERRTKALYDDWRLKWLQKGIFTRY